MQCASDRECSSAGLVCSLQQGQCVQCNGQTDCPNDLTCFRNQCVPTVPCVSSRMCPGQVCSSRLGFCVDCETDIDCPGEMLCRSAECVPPPTACQSSRECSARGLVCDVSRGVCVECVGDTDCTAGEWCSSESTCRRQVCTPGQTSCQDLTRQRTCDLRGSGITVSTCPASQTCRDDRCQVSTCVPGQASCDPASGARRVCNADGGGYTTSACPAEQTCSAGMCVVRACTPTRADCLDSRQRRVCNPDGLTYSTEVCHERPNAAASCVGGVCGIGSCTSGFANCDGDDANGCEVATSTSSVNCGACGVACVSGQTCVAGICRTGMTTRYERIDSPPGVEFVDACSAVASRRILVSADRSEQVDLPFPFRFWSQELMSGARINVNANGWISMLGGTDTTEAGEIPSTDSPNGVVSAFWRNLRASPLGVCVATVGSAPARRWVVEWPSARPITVTLTIDFEVVLHEQSGIIDFVYGTLTGDTRNARAAVGVETPDGRSGIGGCAGGLPFVCIPTSNSSVRFIPVP